MDFLHNSQVGNGVYVSVRKQIESFESGRGAFVSLPTGFSWYMLFTRPYFRQSKYKNFLTTPPVALPIVYMSCKSRYETVIKHHVMKHLLNIT